MLAQANTLVKDGQSGQGQTQWKRRVCRWQWRAQPKRKESRKNNIVEGRSILTASFPDSFMNCRLALREVRGVA